MKSRFQIQPLPAMFCGAVLYASPSFAQPNPIPDAAPKPVANPVAEPALGAGVQPMAQLLAEGDKIFASQLILGAEKQELLETPISFDIRDGTLKQILAILEKAVPAMGPIEIRDAQEIKFSFKVQDQPLIEVLTALATLSQCQVVVLPERVLFAAPDSIATPETSASIPIETQIPTKPTVSISTLGNRYSHQHRTLARRGNYREAQRVSVNLLRQLVSKQKVDALPFKEFSRDYQQLIRFLVVYRTPGKIQPLLPEDRISMVVGDNKSFSLMVNSETAKSQTWQTWAPDPAPPVNFMR